MGMIDAFMEREVKRLKPRRIFFTECADYEELASREQKLSFSLLDKKPKETMKLQELSLDTLENLEVLQRRIGAQQRRDAVFGRKRRAAATRLDCLQGGVRRGSQAKRNHSI